MKFELDTKTFWKENEVCFKPFSTDKPRVPVSLPIDDHFLIEEMGITSTLKYYKDKAYQLELNKQCNDKLETVIGKRFYSERDEISSKLNRFEVIMGAKWELTEGGTPWLESCVEDVEDLKKLIKEAEKIDMKNAAFPEDWLEKKEQFEKETGKPVRLGGNFSRGPATMATSIIGTTNTCMFIMDYPDEMKAFFELLSAKLIEYHEAIMAATGNITINGYSLTDDNCYLFSPKQYEEFCAPVLKKLFDRFAPAPEHKRFQHSDSDMGHLMGILHDLGVNAVNLGPNLHPLSIRKAIHKAVIHGQMPPFTLRNGTHDEIIEIVKRDIDAIAGDGGLIACTAGSVSAGTPLENIKLFMWAVNEFGRY